MPDFELIKYKPEMKEEWDSFADRSKNATFLFKRDYMDYHADRFTDHSIIVLRNGKVHALLPASRSGETLTSHAGLTYGGLLTDRKTTGAETLQIFYLLKERLLKEGLTRMIYKPSPHIYHVLPAEEDLYALFRLGAALNARLISCTICQDHRIKFRDIRKAGIRKAAALGMTTGATSDFRPFWNLLEANLRSRFNASPVHSLEEISRLASLFPDNIRLHVASLDGEIMAGAVIYLSQNVAHTQYIAASPEGKKTGALDLLFDSLVNKEYASVKYFDFGTSNEEGGRILNESLLYQKEGFGGRAICYDSYILDLRKEP